MSDVLLEARGQVPSKGHNFGPGSLLQAKLKERLAMSSQQPTLPAAGKVNASVLSRILDNAPQHSCQRTSFSGCRNKHLLANSY